MSTPTWFEYYPKRKVIKARLAVEGEAVRCYNGMRVAKDSNVVVFDGERTMLMTLHRFESQYELTQEEPCAQ